MIGKMDEVTNFFKLNFHQVKKSIESILCEKMNTTKRDTREGNTVFQE